MTASLPGALRGVALALVVCAAWSTPSEADVVELTTGQKIVGVIKGMTPQGLVIEVQGRTRTIAPRLVRGLAFGPAERTSPAPSAAAAAPPAESAPTPAESTTARSERAADAARPGPVHPQPEPAPGRAAPGTGEPVPALVAPGLEQAAAAGSTKPAPATARPEPARAAVGPAEPAPAQPATKPVETAPAVTSAPTPPRPTIVLARLSPPTLRDALQALFDLRAKAVAGVSPEEYAAGVAQAKPRVDRYLRDGDEARADLKKALTTALRLYSFAASAWGVYADKGDFASVGRDPVIGECPQLQRAIERDAADWKFRADDPAFAGLIAGSEGLPDLWACASDRLGAVEKLLAEQAQ